MSGLTGGGKAGLPVAGTLLVIAGLLSLLPWSGAALAQSPGGEVLRVAWSLQAPYQFVPADGDRQGVTGIDVVAFRTAAQAAGLTVLFQQMPWERALEAVAEGDVDALLASFVTPERRRIGRFSRPLRHSEERLFLPPGVLPAARDADSLLQAIAKAGLRIAVIDGYELGNRFQAFRTDPATADLVRTTDSLGESLDLLEAGAVDGFVMDRLVGTYALAERGIKGMASHAVPIHEADVAALFSRATVAPAVVQRFDEALRRLQASGKLGTIKRQFALPVVIDTALSEAWFEVILLAGMVAFSISAVVIARTGGYGIYGAMILAALPALGGGVARDLLILREPYVFAYPLYVYIVLATLAAGFLVNRLLDLLRGRSLALFDLVNLLLILRRRLRPQLLLALFDAAGLAAFTLVAVNTAAELGRSPLWLWGPVLAALTATGGAILRDMIRRDSDNAILRTAFYGETVILWSLLLSLYLQVFLSASLRSDGGAENDFLGPDRHHGGDLRHPHGCRGLRLARAPLLIR